MKYIILPIAIGLTTILSSYTTETLKTYDYNDISISTSYVDAETEIRKVSSFEKLNVSSAITVQVVDGNSTGEIKVNAPKEAMSKIKTKVVNGVLNIYIEGRLTLNNQKIILEFPHQKLRDVSISGASSVTINHKMKIDKFNANVSGASKLKANLLTNDADIEISGSSAVTLTGNVSDLDVEATGASKFDGENLKANTANVEASGASKIKVWAVSNLDVEASGASKVEYINQKGLNPKIQKSGVSKVNAIS